MVSARTLVTGATGGIGQVLVSRLLTDGREVAVTGRNPTRGAGLSRLGAEFLAADLVTDDLSTIVRGADTIFHLAALSSPWGPRETFVAANEIATERLISAARLAGCRRFIFASTPSIYTRAAHQIGLTETSPVPRRPVNAYAQTKLNAERRVLASATPEFSTLALRPRAVISPYDTVLLPRLLHAARQGLMPLPGHGRTLIEPTDARDVCSAFLAAEQRCETLSGEAFNISGGEPIELRTLASHVFDRLGRRVRFVPLSSHLTLGLAHLAEAGAKLRPQSGEPALTVYSALALGWSQTFNLESARARLGWSPQFSPRTAIDWALEERRHA
jgi:nucleoside-diphosphate-sugar epimerase